MHYAFYTRKKTLLLCFAIVSNCLLSTSLNADTGLSTVQKPRYAPGIITLVQSHDFFKIHNAPSFWKISPFYITQRNDSSCSLASATMLVNAAQSKNLIYTHQESASQDALLTKVNDKTWDEGVKVNGNGITLEQFKQLLPKAFKAYGMSNYLVEAIHVKDNSKETRQKLHEALVNNEKTGNSFIIANFQQQVFTNDEKVGHFSPVAAYDAEKKLVLIMDTYRQSYEPYWVPEELLLKAMMTRDSESNEFRGYLLISPKKS